MNLDEYQQLALRTWREMPKRDALAYLAMKYAGEAGELANEYGKVFGQGHALDEEKLAGELGDGLWFIAVLAHELGRSLGGVAQDNVDKLRKRFPAGFSV